jgi:predicted RNase H-like HicB family nuclease
MAGITQFAVYSRACPASLAHPDWSNVRPGYYSRETRLRPVAQDHPNPAYIGSVTFRAVLEFDPVAQSYSAVCPEWPGCASAGETEEEARQNVEEAIRLYLAGAITIPRPCGFTLMGSAGSHQKLPHALTRKQVIVPSHRGRIPPIRTVRAIVDGSGASGLASAGFIEITSRKRAGDTNG